MEDMEKHMAEYLLYCKYSKALNPKTLKAYRIDLTQFMGFLASESYRVNRESMTAYIASLHQHFGIKTVKRKIASVKAFLNYLEYEEIIETNPFNKLRIKLHEPSLLPRIIPFSSISTILHCAYSQKADCKTTQHQKNTVIRDIAVLEMLFATGLRVSELCSLKKDDVDLDEGTVKIFGKGAKERLLQIGNQQVLAALHEYSCVYHEQIEMTGWFFINRLGKKLSDQSVRTTISRYTNMAGLTQHITPHMFRHSFATLLLDEGVDIRYIQQLLGHSSIVTTQIYTHVASKKQRDILTTKHPRNKIVV